MNKYDKVPIKNSLLTKFTIFVVLLFAVFIGLILYSHNKFDNHKNLLLDISKVSIPKVIRISNIYADVREFSFLLDRIVTSKSYAKKRISYKKALNNIEFIEQSDVAYDKQYLKKIKKEFDSIINLVKKQTNHAKTIDLKILEFDEKVKDFIQNLGKNSDNYEIISALEDIRLMIIFDSEQSEMEFLHIKNSITRNLKFIEMNLKRKSTKDRFLEIKDILLVKDNILDLQQQRIDAKAEISSIAVLTKSLINNFSDEIRYMSVKNNQQLIEEVEKSSKQLGDQTQVVSWLFVLSLVFLAFVIIYFKEKIITRLVRLNDFISSKNLNSISSNEVLEDNEEDEISNIVHSYNFYALKIEELSLTDGLTGVANKRFFEIRLKNELARATREEGKLSLIMIDIDDFKLYNDTYGHLKGDACLRSVANALKKIVKRDCDLVARYGGEEFVIILYEADIKNSKMVAKSLVEAVRDLGIAHKTSSCADNVTISVGVKSFYANGREKGDDILAKADKALYYAKNSGKNTFVHYDEFRYVYENVNI